MRENKNNITKTLTKILIKEENVNIEISFILLTNNSNNNTELNWKFC